MKPGRMMPGGMNMQAMMKQAQKLQADMMKKQEELEKMEFTASAGGGVVTATSGQNITVAVVAAGSLLPLASGNTTGVAAS